ncbi:glucose dehydrogenase [Caerostris extrusa]|uniref:Glucose dehydrogenase n=1 Tax=Caerostris extrusa TaxID=172846 RepID=A0AAV4UDG5_CAEEX|nr:glucose dehydrogenase [Caerostris extrusa]
MKGRSPPFCKFLTSTPASAHSGSSKNRSQNDNNHQGGIRLHYSASGVLQYTLSNIVSITFFKIFLIGAGTAGSVVASRLSEECCVSVLLLEAGKAPPLLSAIPGIAASFLNSDLDWKYRTAPQKYTGSAQINSARCSRVELRGSVALFLKQEDNLDLDFVANGFHAVGGPTPAQRPRYESEIQGPILEAAEQFGYNYGDPNGAQQTGKFSDMQGIMEDGQKRNDAENYLVPVENRTNLDILTNAHVNKIIMKGCQAEGVEFSCKGSKFVVKAKREVIVSAGVTNTPKLLMLSGIGPRKHLEKFKVRKLFWF